MSLLVILSNFGARRLYEQHGYITTKLFVAKPIFLFGTNVGIVFMKKKLI